MEDIRNYLQMLIDGLQKKQKVLEDIQEIVQEQAVILGAEEMDQTAFDNSMAKKADLIAQLEKLNDGFENVYDRVRDDLMVDKEKYREQIKILQELIAVVSEKSIHIETMEERNKNKADNFFNLRRREIRSLRRSNTVANSYQQTMTGQAYLGTFDIESTIDRKN